jgi:transcriptional regulator with XRE-family HTH domain
MSNTGKSEIIIRSQDDLRNALLQARIASKLSQQEAANETDINRTYLSRLEKGQIDLAYMDRVLDLLKTYGATITVSFENKVD